MLKSKKALIYFLSFSLVLTFSFALGLGEMSVSAEEWHPDGPVRGIAWASAGGGSDRFVRGQIEGLNELGIWDVNLIPETRPGAGGAEGMRYVLSQEADGHYWLAVTPSLVNVPLSTDLGFNWSSFTPIAQLAEEPLHLAVRADDDRFDTIEDFVEYAEENPGTVSIGTFGTGSQMDTALHLFAGGLDLNINPVPFEGTGDRHAALLGGHIDASINNYGDDANQLESGEMKSLLIFGEEEFEELPGVPTVEEAFGFEVVVTQWRGAVVHGDTPDHIVEEYGKVWEELYHTDAFQDYLEREGITGNFRGPEEFADFIENQHNMFERIFREQEIGLFSN